jgi:hypothetical protein
MLGGIVDHALSVEQGQRVRNHQDSVRRIACHRREGWIEIVRLPHAKKGCASPRAIEVGPLAGGLFYNKCHRITDRPRALRLFIRQSSRNSITDATGLTIIGAMMDPEKPTPIVEGTPNGQVASGSDTDLRLRQQEILAELGVLALQGTPFPELLTKTAALTAKGLEAEFCKVLEYQHQERRFLVTAGVGWGSDVVGVATVGADIESPAGFALITGKPVISNHLENEERFRTLNSW